MTFHISGGRRLTGSAITAGAKNAALPLLAACVTTRGETVLRNCPDLSDVRAMLRILEKTGCNVSFRDGEVRICCDSMSETNLDEKLAHELRSSVFLLGPVLAAKHEVSIGMPGGCDIGSRPVNIHLDALRKLGAHVEEKDGRIVCKAPELHGSEVTLPFPSVGATENLMMAAATARGKTSIKNAAREPEIEELQNFLNAMGAEISGAGSSFIKIDGVKELHGVEWRIMPDRIEAGTLMLAAAVTGGEVFIKDAPAARMRSFTDCVRRCGAEVREEPDGVLVRARGTLKAAGYVETEPYPGFPTDMQSQFLAAMTKAGGVTVIKENIFENRFHIVKPLRLMGADISLSGRCACVSGVRSLHAARVKAKDLRGGAALVIAALMAEGKTVIENADLMDRGYFRLEETLRVLGADAVRVQEEQQ